MSENPALQELALTHGRELQVADASFAGSLGRIEVEAERARADRRRIERMSVCSRSVPSPR